MLLNAALLVLLGVVVHRTWLLSQFMRDGAKGLQIFLLTMISGLCLITNVIVPFVIAGLVVTALELRTILVEV